VIPVELKREHTLLLVDDEHAIIRALKRLFRKEGYTILTAESGPDGLEQLKQCKTPVS
jgi:CheY-like chemotaxis protein